MLLLGWIHIEEGLRWPRSAPTRVRGLPLWEAALPPGSPRRRGRQGAGALRRAGVRRALVPPALAEELSRRGVVPVSPLPLCRAMGDRLALALLGDLPLRRRVAALRGDRVTAEAVTLALVLCPQVGTLLLDFGEGEEWLGEVLRQRQGAPPLHLGQGPPPQVCLELSPVEPWGEGSAVLRLWGEPQLGGLTLTAAGEVPEGMEELTLLEVLWETGRSALKDIQVAGKP